MRHIASTASEMMMPSWLLGRRGEPTRESASRQTSSISRVARRREVRMLLMCNRVYALRRFSPWKGLAAMAAWITSNSAASGIGPGGPCCRGASVRRGKRSQVRLTGRQEGVAPATQHRRQHSQQVRDQFQVIAPQQPQHRAALAPP